MKKLILSTFAALSLLVGGLTGTSFAANPASFTLSPAGGSVNNGSSFGVGIYENGDNVNVVTVNLTYDASKLQLTAESCGGAFTTASQSGSTISCFIPGGTAPVSGSQLAVNASFKAIANGSAVVGFGSGSMIASGGANIWSGNTSGGTFTVTTPASQPTNPTSPTGGSGGTGSTGNSNPTTNSSSQKSTNGTSASTNSSSAGNGNATTNSSGKVAAASTKAKAAKSATTKRIKFADAIAQPSHTVRNVAVATSLLVALAAAGLIWLIRDGKKLSLSFAKLGKK